MVAATSALVALVILPSLAIAAPFAPKGCVLDEGGLPVCSRLEGRFSAENELSSVARFRKCADGDEKCFCLKAVEITNDIRARKGDKTKLIAGNQVMLDNAMKWSKKQMDSYMHHQNPLPALGCDTQVNRENVAWFQGYDRDPAVQCKGFSQ